MPPPHARPSARRFRAAALAASLIGLSFTSAAVADAPAPDAETAAFEIEYLEMMIDHHQMGVHMSEMCLERAVHTDLLELCDDIATTQAAEIELMQSWLVDWYGIHHEPSMDDMTHHMQMEELSGLSGDAFEMAFLEMMSEHHVMAVVDSRECLGEASHAELRRLCASIMSTQLREIAQMQRLLCRWYGQCDLRHLTAA